MFLAFKLLRVGVSQAKKHKSKSKAKSGENYHQQYYQQPYPPAQPYPQAQSYPQTQPYPADYVPGGQPNMHIPMPPTYSSGLSTGGESAASGSAGDKKRTLKTHAETAVRSLQFILSLAVIGLYGHDIQPSASSSDPRWVYAVAVGFVSALTTFIYILCNLFFMKSRPLATRVALHLPVFVWESVLVVNWMTVFGIFGKMFLGVYKHAVERMRHAVYLDLVLLVLFLGSVGWVGMRWWKSKTTRTGTKDGEAEKGVET